METIALFFVFAAAVFYIWRRIAGAVKTDRPEYGCGGGCKGCSAATGAFQRQARTHTETAPRNAKTAETPDL